MRKRWIIVGIVFLALAGGYTGYWFWLADTFQRNLALWVEQQRRMGYQISFSASEPEGYPLPVRIRLTEVVVRSSGSRPWRFDSGSMEVSISPWNPMALRVDDGAIRPQYRLQWHTAARGYDVTIEGLAVTIRLATEGRSPAIEFDDQSVAIRDRDRYVAGIIDFGGHVSLFEAKSQSESSATFKLSAYGINFNLPPPADAVETYGWHFEGRVMGPLRPETLPRALADWSSAGGYLELTEVRASWELLTEMNAEGSFALDAELQPIGSMTAELRGYPAMIDWLVSIGKMTSAQGTATKLALGAKGRRTTDPVYEWESRVPLTIQDGYVSVGAMKVAQVPRFSWQ